MLTCVTLVLLVWQNIRPDSLPTAFYSAESGVILISLFVVLGGAAEMLARRQRQADAVYYIVAAAVLGPVGLALVSVPDRGIDAPIRAMIVCLVCGVGGLALNHRCAGLLPGSINIALLVGTTLWGLFAFVTGLAQLPWWAAVLAVESVALASLATRLGWHGPWVSTGDRRGLYEYLVTPVARSAEAVALLVIGVGIFAGLLAGSWSPAHVVTAAGLCAALLVLAVAEHRRDLARLAGVMLSGAAVACAGWLAAGVIQAGNGDVLAALALALTVAAAVMSVISLRTQQVERAGQADPVLRYAVLSGPWRDTAVVSGVGVLALCAVAWSSGDPWLVSLSLAFVAVGALALARRNDQPAWTWIGLTLALVGLLRISAVPTPADLLGIPNPTLGYCCTRRWHSWRRPSSGRCCAATVHRSCSL